MTPLAAILRDRIRRDGPIPFRDFMETALYHPEHGYYRRPRDPFGRAGDFYTAEQIQPVFGILVAQRVRLLWRAMGEPADFTVVELGAGRREMAEAFSSWRYIPVDLGDSLPERFCGVVFSNEFFDALPVHAIRWTGGEPRERLVGLDGGRFTWIDGPRASGEIEEYLREFFPERTEGRLYEVNLEALSWMDRIARSLEAGYVVSIDYGYDSRESIRFPEGTLMSYRGHGADEDVLADPGERDLTAHVCFSALQKRGQTRGLDTLEFATLRHLLLDAGEADQFAAALAADSEEDAQRRRLQLKTLLFGMGETFRTLLQATAGMHGRGKTSGK